MQTVSCDTSPDLIDRVLASATPLETPCGDGRTVWHRWGPPAPGALAPVVLLHGGSGSWTHWVRNIQALVDTGRQVLVPDLPGFGDSAKPPCGSDADAVAPVLAEGLQILLQGRPCDLVGFSFGGMVGGMLTAASPALVARLVLVGAPALGVATRRAVVLHPWRHLTDPEERQAAHRSNLAALMLYRPEAIDALALTVQSSNVVRDRMQGRRLAYTETLREALMLVHCPVHAIYGREDVLYRGRTDPLAAALQGTPSFRHLALIDDAGHWVQFEQPLAFHAALMAALNA